ncbi:amidohydrolase [Lewinella sp. W8]|uniref:amidohydrolase n=1 Tax=Lewinella sp. W8 TaxID=2528208 RepID=UPI001068C906|nr:amidohydrolase [Lewinella sp. W8]MTB49679.1 amidohydrolase [Lewinella sp. W8]
METAMLTLRHHLHRHPELSGLESGTARHIKDFLQQHYPPDTFLEALGGHGLAAVYAFGEGPAVVFRCELDALPIAESDALPWSSIRAGVAHKCGHDGHMAMVAGLIFSLREQPPVRGRVVLLFQPAEETGRGAAGVLADPRFIDLKPDYLFALHNIPGAELGKVLVMEAGFSAEVISCALIFTGRQAHAAQPEEGRNPAYAIGEILARLRSLNVPDPAADDFALLTPVHCRVGQLAYGIAPGRGELHYTLRTWSAETMTNLRRAVTEIVKEVTQQQQLDHTIDWREHFPASQNDPGANALVRRAAVAAGLPLEERPYPFRFGEDFGWFSQRYRTAMFGLGGGLDTPPLHHEDYDFPDSLLPQGTAVFSELVRLIMQE